MEGAFNAVWIDIPGRIARVKYLPTQLISRISDKSTVREYHDCPWSSPKQLIEPSPSISMGWHTGKGRIWHSPKCPNKSEHSCEQHGSKLCGSHLGCS